MLGRQESTNFGVKKITTLFGTLKQSCDNLVTVS